ncbi:hypothetical protein HSBAA_14980 [Vreelandella sulfidaeris]|uniref:Uncharacterized protein n=1 Tax=Vreelandella sulfidaeris TaxID=115553 RepID=A0A455U2E4_9GAMM|nr:hypothetical protein HSBAA_14980 [Halomonas sulfidaeris]
MAVNQVERAFRAWPVLTGVAKQRGTITYGELGAAIGVHHRAIRYVLATSPPFSVAAGFRARSNFIVF